MSSRMTRVRGLRLACALLDGSAALAQAPAPPDRTPNALDTLRVQAAPVVRDTLLERLTQEALAANPELRSQAAMARAAGARVRAAGALPDPMLTAGVMDLTLPRFAFRESDFTEVDVELSQEFPWPGTLAARTRRVLAGARSREATAASLQRELTTRVADLYYRLRYAVTAEATLAAQRRLLESGVDVATARYAAGRVPQADPLGARLVLARLVAEAAALDAEAAALRAELRALRNVRGADRLEPEPITSGEVAALLAGADRWRAAAPEPAAPLNHPRLQIRQAELAAAEAMAEEERLGARPDFTLITRYGARPVGADFFSAFVGIRIPIWAGRKQARLAEAARLESEGAREALAQETAALQAEIERTRAVVRASAGRLEVLARRVVPAAEETAAAARRSYQVGQAEFLGVLAAEDALYRARLEVADVAAEHLSNLVRLEQLLREEESP